MKNIAISGANGFVGKALFRSLKKDHKIKALVRELQNSQQEKNVEWCKCDLFSRLETELALKDVEYAFFLSHSLLPSARLTQGNYSDADAIIAHNFAHSAKVNNVKRIIYLGCVIPENEVLSSFQNSRLEVEEILRSTGVSVVTLRTSLVVGGFIWDVLQNLPSSKIHHLKLQPMSIVTLVEALESCLDENISWQTKNIVGAKIISIQEMMDFAIWPKKCNFRFPKATSISILGYLMSNLVVEDENSIVSKISYKQPMPFELAEKKYSHPEKKEVRSIQRLPLPSGKNADWVAKEYPKWLSRFMFFAMYVKFENANDYTIYMRILRLPLLKLTFVPEESDSDRHLLHINGGIFTKVTKKKARFEIRKVPNKPFVFTAIHDFEPALPWIFYNMTEALAHLWVMHSFGYYLKRWKVNKK